MPYETYMGTFKNENDHNLQRKFGYKYRALKGIYPDAYKLPETEVSKAIDVFFDGDANEDVTTMTDRVRNYTTAKEPEWKAKYFGEGEQKNQSVLQQKSRIQSEMEQLQHQIRAKDIIRKNIENYNNKGFYLTGNQWLDVAKATGDGMISGAESALDGATLGGYSFADKWYLDGQMAKRRERLDQEAQIAGLGKVHDLVHLGIGKIAENIPYATAYKCLKNLAKANVVNITRNNLFKKTKL